MADSPGIQQQLGSDSALPEIPYKGTLYKLGRPDQDAKGRLEKLVKRVAIDEVRALKDALPPAAYAELFAERTKNLKQYDTWREGWKATVFEPANAHLFLWSLLQAHHPTITAADVLALATEAPEEVSYALAQVMPAFFRMLLEGIALTPDQQQALEEKLSEFRERLTPTPKTPST
mgnify:FL=1